MLQPLSVEQGGPVLMVQLENEYGFYGSDSGYLDELQRAWAVEKPRQAERIVFFLQIPVVVRRRDVQDAFSAGPVPDLIYERRLATTLGIGVISTPGASAFFVLILVLTLGKDDLGSNFLGE